MSKKVSRKIPELRFYEFKDDWDTKKLGSMGKFIGGGTPSTFNHDHWVGNIPWISSSDIYENSIHEISTTRFINEQAIKDSTTKLVPPRSILINSRV